MKKSLNILFLISLLIAAACSHAQIPTGYYNNAQGKSGAELKTALRNIIYSHTEVSYEAIWYHFDVTDADANHQIEDIYSNCDFYYPTHQSSGGNGSECGSYNREHSFPKSWFGGENKFPMFTDLFHVYPTDSYDNSRRNNNPYGKVAFPTYTTSNGSKLGKNIEGSYSGTVFEPADEYKGDLARTYFYMATCYENVLHDWVVNYASATALEEVLDGSTFPAFNNWYLRMLYSWHKQDPVSQKEINRNNAVYAIQHNRNPFIDHPEWVDSIWHNYLCDPCTNTTNSVTFPKPGGVYYDSVEVVLTNNDPQSVIYYTTNGNVPTAASQIYQNPFKIESSTVIRAFAHNPNYSQSLYTASTYYIITTSDVITATVSNAYPASQGNSVKIALYCNNMSLVPEVNVTNSSFEVNKSALNLNLENHHDTLLVWTNERIIDSTYVVITYGERHDSLKVRSSDAVIAWDFENQSALSNYAYVDTNINIPIFSGTGKPIDYTPNEHSIRTSGWNSEGNYWQTAAFSTKNIINTTLKFKQYGSNTSPKNWKIQYKIGKGNFMLDTYGTEWRDVPGGSYIISSTTSMTQYEVPLTAHTWDQREVLLRWQVVGNTSVSGANIGGSGTVRLANVEINGEAGTYSGTLPKINSNENGIKIYSNPVTSELHFELLNSNIRGNDCSIFDSSGKHFTTLLLLHSTNTTATVDVSRLPSGTYFLKIGDYTAKFVKSH
jgi:endonuclease I